MIDLLHGGCLELMKTIESESVDNIITSPPYNLGGKRKDCYYDNGYNHIDNLTESEYLDVRVEEFKEFQRVLNRNGVILYNISYHNENPILPTLLMSNIHQQTDFTIADIIVWKKPHSIPFQTSPTKLSRLCELIYVIVNKSSLHTFKTNKEVSSVNPKTKQKFYKNYTNLVEAKNNDGYKSSHKATFSQELVSKLLNIYVNKGSTVLDPFMGIGTTGLACIEHQCDFIGIEILEEYFEIAKNRINERN